MKKIFLRAISLILLLATLMPLAVSCKDDPPPDNDDDDNENEGGDNPGEETETMETIGTKLSNTVTTKIIDFESAESRQALLTRNAEIDAKLNEKLVFKDGKYALEYQTSTENYYRVYLPEQVDISDCHTVTFDIYAEGPSDTIFQFWLKSCAAAVDIRIDFTGWKHFELKIDALSVANPYPKIDRLEIKQSSGSNSPKVWIGSFEAQRLEFQLDVPAGVDINDPTIYDQIVVNFREYLIGNKETQSLAAYQSSIASLNASAKSCWDSFKATYQYATEQRNFLFDIDMRLGYDGWEYVKWDEEKTYAIYRKIVPMAKAYASEGSAYYKNPELLADIIKALDYCYDVFYGQCVIDRGTVGNWWPWDIGCPMELIPILVYIEDALTAEQIKHYLKAYDYLMPFPVGSGGNLCDFAISIIVAGALERDAYRICQAKYLTKPLFEYITIDKMGAGADGGFFTDGSFIQHSVTPYAGGYGVVIVETLPKLINITNGTHFAFDEQSIRTSFGWMFDTYHAIMYNGNLMGGHIGRGIGTDEPYNFNRITKGMLYMLPYCPEDIKADFRSLVRTLLHQAGQSFYDSVPLIFSTMVQELYDDATVPLINDYHITKVFGNECRISHHGPEYGVSISLSSERITKYESINGANFTGWYQGDGMIYLYTDGYNHGGQYFYYANPYLMPGTTVNLSERGRGNIHPTIPNASSFAGGVEHGKYGAAAFILGYDYATTRGTFLEGENAAKIEAKKSYFMFDNEVVCLGSDINDYSGKDVVTVVENRLWRESDKFYIDGTEISGSALHTHNIITPSTGQTEQNQSAYWGLTSHPASALLIADYRKELTGVRTMHFTNMGGYVFLNGETVSYSKTTINGDPVNGTISTFTANKSQTFLELTIEHGKGDGSLDNSKYAYVYLPDATKEQTDAYSVSSDIEILALTDKAHAVYEKNLGIFSANVFYDSGATVRVNATGAPISKLETETPLSMMISKNAAGETVISVSDPSQSYRQLVFTVYADGLTQLAAANDKVNAQFDSDAGCVYVVVNTEGACGDTFTFTVK